MALRTPIFSIIKKNNRLEPCWMAGKHKASTINAGNLTARRDVISVDVVDCCDEINAMMEHGINTIVPFKDISRLTIGLAYLFSQQVLSLLDETKHLLKKMERTNFEFDLPETFPTLLRTQQSRKRKRFIATTTTTKTVCVTKRTKISAPLLPDEESVDYYKNMLGDSISWTKHNDILKCHFSQTQHTCISEKLISIQEQMTEITSIDQDIMWNDGFGESNQMKRTTLDEFLPHRNSLKRKSSDLSASNLFCLKRSREGLDASITNDEISPQVVDLDHEIDHIALSPISTPSPPIVTAQIKKRKKTHKLKIDSSIRLTRDQLMKERYLYCVAKKIEKPHKLRNNNIFLNRFRLSHLFPERLQKQCHPSWDQMQIDSELTIRSIFGKNYSDEMAKNILDIIPSAPKPNNMLDDFVAPVLLSETLENSAPQSLEVQESSNNNNNNVYSYTHIKNDKTLDAFSVMSNLLSIWRKNPKMKSIDANRFVKSFPRRITAALAFRHLLSLLHDGFIGISKKEKSLEIDQINLGPQSIELIENMEFENNKL